VTAPARFEVVAVAIGDNLIRLGQTIHRRYAVAPAGEPDAPIWRAQRWRSHVQAFVLHGDPLKFSQRKMIAAGIVTRPSYDGYMKLLQKAGVLHVYARSGAAWDHRWDRRKFCALVRRGLVSLPYPLDKEPWPVLEARTAVAQRAQRSAAAQVSFAAAAPAVASTTNDGDVITRQVGEP
jgi:hypothetical protein